MENAENFVERWIRATKSGVKTGKQELINMINMRDEETTQQAAQRALYWYDSPALYYGPDQQQTARETLYKSVLGEV